MCKGLGSSLLSIEISHVIDGGLKFISEEIYRKITGGVRTSNSCCSVVGFVLTVAFLLLCPILSKKKKKHSDKFP